MADVSVNLALVEITQCLQYPTTLPDGTVRVAGAPLVRGKPTVVRVFPERLPSGDPVVVSARLRAIQEGLPSNPIEPDNGPLKVTWTTFERGDLQHSLNFTLEPPWYEGETLELEVELFVVGSDQVIESEVVSELLASRSGLAIEYLEVIYENSEWQGATRPRARVKEQAACGFLRSVYPADPTEITYEPHPAVELAFDRKHPDSANGSIFAGALIGELLAMNVYHDGRHQLYAWTPDDSCATLGLAQLPNVALGNDDGKGLFIDAWRSLMAHEIDHNVGLHHDHTTLKDEEFGFDVMGLDPLNRGVMRSFWSPNAPTELMDLRDVMFAEQFDYQRWITPKSYEQLFDSLKPTSVTTEDVPSTKEYLVVSGLARRDKPGEFFPFRRLVAREDLARRPPPPQAEALATHRIIFHGEEKPISQIAWKPEFARHELQSRAGHAVSEPFVWFVEPHEGVKRITLEGPSGQVTEFHVPQTAPAISNSTRKPATTGVELQWDGGRDNETLSRDVYYSSDDRQTWRLLCPGLTGNRFSIDETALEGGEKCYYQVRTSNGFDDASVELGPFRIADRPWRTRIIAPGVNKVFRKGAGALFLGYGIGPQGQAASKLQWWIEGDSQPRGTGRKLVLRDLPVGKHRVSLRIEGQAEAQTDEVTVQIEDQQASGGPI